MLPDMNSTASGGDESQRKRNDGIDNKSSSENLDNNSINNQELKRKRYHRHTPEQIQEMEAFFKQHPHPNHNQRKELSDKLGLEPLQVKFWFQNKRTQLKRSLSNARCRACGRAIVVDGKSSNEHCLRVENAQLREQIEYLAAILAKFVGKSLENDVGTPSSTASPTIDTKAVRKLKGKQKMEE
ncbi:Homeobox-leucine zipper protein ROC2 [Sesamum angolense]|uniref:Homeobox-leucine zipper protein ROC2 n=1 Tax=Sesamum angolense TaxID=2727404 RepID=A0AAE1WQY2_9LAMI|nr:Homeobox-leucine zipper protein ROC2 [Sesamum angolense]